MELDLDSLLRSYDDDGDEENSDDSIAAFRHRTVDEILNDSNSSDSDQQTSPPKEPISRVSSQTLENEQQSSLTLRGSRSSLPSLGFRFVDRPLPPLFGSVRPNPKPGVALAAAAAASRSIPTPHAAAIKNRRASSNGSIQKIESFGDLQATEEDQSDVVSEPSLSELPVEAGAVGLLEEVEKSCSVEEVHESHLAEGEYGKFDDLNSGIVTNENVSDENTIDENIIYINATSENTVDEKVHQVDDAVLIPELVEPGNQEITSEAQYDEEDSDFDKKSSHNGELDGLIGGYEDTEDEIDKLVEERLEKVENSEEAEEKLRASMKPLELAEELEKRNASYGLHWEEGAAAQPMRLEGIRSGPPAVGYLQIDLDNAVTRTISSHAFKRDYGSPQVVAVHMNFVAMGTSKGIVLVFPSKYSAHSVDLFDTKMLVLGSHGTKPQTSVTSMCFNQLGDLLLVGYGDGNLTLWDVHRATAKVNTGEHSAPVVHTLFLGQFKAVTGDSKGLIFLHTFSVVPLLNRFTVKSQCLLDGTKNGIVLSASPLLIDDSQGIGCTSAQWNSTVPTSGLGSMVGGVVGGVVGSEAGWKLFNEGSSSVEEGVVIFVTHQNALVVRLLPNVEIYDQFSRPDGVREGSMPYTAWKCTSHIHDTSPDESDKAPWLVIAWDRRVQVAQLVKSKVRNFSKWNLDSMAIGVAWLDDQMLVVLTLRGQLCLFAKDGTKLHHTSFVLDGSGLDDIISYHTHITNTFGNPEKAYHNSISVRGATIYILGSTHLLISRLLPWKERIQVLQRAGDWMGALDMAMRLFDGHAQGVIDLPRNVDAIREAIMPYLVELLLSYVDEVFSYISVAFSNQIGKVGQLEDTKFTDRSVQSEIEEQYARVGGVAVEFCVHIKRTDILFDIIFSKFVTVNHGGTFLEILEPYILRDMLGCLPPEIMQALVEHYSAKGWLQRVEQCVLHMDIASLDFNQVVKLCREHGLFGALIYLFNRGLDDFKAPLEELLVVIQNSPSSDVAAIGYRMLVYLKYCFQGLAFPPGTHLFQRVYVYAMPVYQDMVLSPLLVCHQLERKLLQFLLEDSKFASSEVLRRFESLHGNCPKLCYLLLIDTEAAVEVLRHAFPEEEHTISDVSLGDLDASCMEQGREYHTNGLEIQKVMAQNMVDVLISILDLESDVIKSFTMDESNDIWPSTKDMGQLLEFIAFLVACCGANIYGRILKHILEYLTSCNPSKDVNTTKKEKQVLCLLSVIPQTEWDSSYVLHLCTDAHFYQACGFIHTVSGQYTAALDSYMKDMREPVHAFAFINSMILQLKDEEVISFQLAVISRVAELVKLNRECAYFLVIDHFSSKSQDILAMLHCHPQSLFLFLKTAIDVHLSGTLKFSILNLAEVSKTPTGRMRDISSKVGAYLERLSNCRKLLHHNMIEITDEIAELYLELLCKYERNSVLKFLETFDNYRLEHCLRLCQEYGVTDAAAFLLERAGDVGSALGLVMAGLPKKIDLLVTAVENKCSDATSISAEKDQFTSFLRMTEVIYVHDVLNASIGLCQRNSRRLDQQESVPLWFRLLDSFSEPLRRLYHDTEFPKTRKHVNILRSVFSKFVGEIIEGMVGYIPLPVIMEKLLSDNGNQEFGDFKSTILKMLGTYGYEKRILDTAKSLIEDDTFNTMGVLKKGAARAFVPDSTCCICGCPLSKGFTSFGIRVFNCGHSTHLHCESEDGETSSNKFGSVGCPVCLPKKNSRAKNKSVRSESGLVSTSTSISRPSLGTSSIQHAHEPEFERYYASHQKSRFEILSNLQKSHEWLQIDAVPQLKLSPPAIYHEKVQKGAGLLAGEASNTVVKNEKSNKRWQRKEVKGKGTHNRLLLKTSLFGNEKNRVR